VFSRFRLAGAAVTIGVGVIAVAFYATISNHFLGQIISRTVGPFTDQLAEYGFASHDPDIWRRMAERHELTILVEPPGGEPLAYDDHGRLVPPPEIGGGKIVAVRTAADGTRATFLWTLWSFPNAHLPLMGGLLVMVALVVGSAFWFLQRQLAPLAALHDGVDAVARGSFDVVVPVVRDDEIGHVARAFNGMARRVGEMIDDRERLLADVSHELRSPLARMKVALELMPPGAEREAMVRDVREMEHLTSVLLERESLRFRAGRLEGREFDLGALVREVVASFAGQGPPVRLATHGAIAIHADPVLIKLLMRNLIDNAVKFSRPDSGPIAIALATEARRAVLHVTDDGIGIPAGSEEDVFKPFFKSDRSRGHRVGYGIGLDLCQRIVHLHGGTIRLQRREPRGPEAVVTLPRSSPVG